MSPSLASNDCAVDMEDWDDCDTPLAEPQPGKSHAEQKLNIREFCMFDNTVNGVKSELVKPPPKKSLVASRGVKKNFNITILQSPLQDLKPYEQNEESLLPPSLLLASRNLLSHGQVLSAQRAVGDTRPYFFYGAQMYPAILRGTMNMNKPLKDLVTNMTPAIVSGVRRQRLRDRPWPAAYHSDQSHDSIVGMLAFSIPVLESKNLDRFQGGSSARSIVRARFKLDDGRSAEVECEMYMTGETGGLAVRSEDERPWRVSELMQDPWHRQNLSSARSEEAALSNELC